MSSFFSQIRKDPNMAGTVKELSDRIAQIQPAIDDGETTIRLLRTDEDHIEYADTNSNTLGGDRDNPDNVAYGDTAASFLGPKTFRVMGGDFLTFHVDLTATKYRDFVRGSGGFFRSTDERAYVGYSEAS